MEVGEKNRPVGHIHHRIRTPRNPGDTARIDPDAGSGGGSSKSPEGTVHGGAFPFPPSDSSPPAPKNRSVLRFLRRGGVRGRSIGDDLEITTLSNMGSSMRNRSGQALVETALALPCLLILLTGSFVAARAISLTGSAESAAFTLTLREGRRQASIGDNIAKSISPLGKGITVHTDRNLVSPLLPSIIPSPEGRTRCTVHIDKNWPEAGRIASWPAFSTERWIEASVDCWDRQTPSGRKASAAIRAYILLRSIL
jgi:TadE-like protein